MSEPSSETERIAAWIAVSGASLTPPPIAEVERALRTTGALISQQAGGLSVDIKQVPAVPEGGDS